MDGISQTKTNLNILSYFTFCTSFENCKKTNRMKSGHLKIYFSFTRVNVEKSTRSAHNF